MCFPKDLVLEVMVLALLLGSTCNYYSVAFLLVHASICEKNVCLARPFPNRIRALEFISYLPVKPRWPDKNGDGSATGDSRLLLQTHTHQSRIKLLQKKFPKVSETDIVRVLKEASATWSNRAVLYLCVCFV